MRPRKVVKLPDGQVVKNETNLSGSYEASGFQSHIEVHCMGSRALLGHQSESIPCSSILSTIWLAPGICWVLYHSLLLSIAGMKIESLLSISCTPMVIWLMLTEYSDCISLLELPYQSQSEWLKQQKLIFLDFWVLEVYGPDAAGLDSSEASRWFRYSSGLQRSSYCLFSVHISLASCLVFTRTLVLWVRALLLLYVWSYFAFLKALCPNTLRIRASVLSNLEGYSSVHRTDNLKM